MKEVLLFLLALVMFAGVTYSQTVERNGKIKAYRIIVKFVDQRPQLKGYLHSVADSSIVLIPTGKNFKVVGEPVKQQILVTDIKVIKKSLKRAAIIGAIPGAAGAAFLGVIAVAWGSPGYSIPILMVVGGAFTSLVSLGIASKNYRIKGDLKRFSFKYMGKLKKKAIL